MSSKRTVSIIIPVWNNWHLTRACLHSIHENTGDVDYQVILVDNHSTDDTPSSAQPLGSSLFGDSFQMLRMPSNLGFAKACNQGAWASNAKYLLFLNNDTTVTQGWLAPLVSALQNDRKCAGAGPLLLFPQSGDIRSGRVQHLGIASSFGPDFRHLYELFPGDHPLVNKSRRFSIITAAALMLHAQLFKAENGFHEGFVNGMEDVDLCCRIAGRGGYFTVVPESVVHHWTNRTPGRFEKERENTALLMRRCKGVQEDLHKLVEADGFATGLTDWLDITVRQTEEHNDELRATLSESSSIDNLQQRVHANPLWDEGYAFLVHQAQAAGKPSLALTTAYLRSLLCPGLEAFEVYAALARQHGNPELITRNEAIVANIKNTLENRTALAKRANQMEKAARSSHLQAALADWKKRFSP